MFLLTEKTMAGGRPKSEDGDQTTRQVRVFVDIADMVGWIHYFEREKSGENVAQIIDPMIRDAVVKRYMEALLRNAVSGLNSVTPRPIP